MKMLFAAAAVLFLAKPLYAMPFAKGVKIKKIKLNGTGCYIETDEDGNRKPNYTVKIKNRKGKASLKLGFTKLGLNSGGDTDEVSCSVDVIFEVLDENVKFYIYRTRIRGTANLKEGVSVKFAPFLSLPMHDEEIPNQKSYPFEGPMAGGWNEGIAYDIPQMPKCGQKEYRVTYDLDLYMDGNSDIASEFNITSKDATTTGKDAVELDFKVESDGCKGYVESQN